MVYHGSNVKIDKIDLNKSHKYKDFGKGFYVTAIKEQAILMAKQTVKLIRGETYCNII